MSLSFMQKNGNIGFLYPVSRDRIMAGGKPEYKSIMDFGIDFRTFIQNTIIPLIDVSHEDLSRVGITKNISRYTYSKSVWLKLKVNGDEFSVYIDLEKGNNIPRKVTATYYGLMSSFFGGAIKCSKRVFNIEIGSWPIYGDTNEEHFSFSTEETSYSDGERITEGSYVSACALHPDGEVAFSEEKGGYVINYKDIDKRPKIVDGVPYESDGSKWTQPTFCSTTYPNGFDGALADAKQKIEPFQLAWNNALVQLGVAAPTAPHVKARTQLNA